MNPQLARKWKDLFNSARANFLESTSSITIAQRSYRLRELNTIYQNQKNARQQNTKAMKDTLEQAAKESGDAYTNKQRHEVTGKNGGPVQTVAMTLDEWNKNAEKRLKEASESLGNFDE